MSLLYVREMGPKEAPAILFLHGLGLSHTMWRPQFERLGDFYHCLAPDLPECGNSRAIQRLNGHILHLASHERLADFLLECYDIPHTERRILLADLRTVKPEAIEHFLQGMTRWELPHNGQTPILAIAGRLETFVNQQAVYQVQRTLPGARGALVPRAGHFWTLEFPDLFTQTVRTWIEDEPLPNRLLHI